MIPQLPRDDHCTAILAAFFTDIQHAGFSGDISTSEAARVLASNDNSIWEQTPSAVIAPRTADDVSVLLKILATPKYKSIKITPRGGGTSTAGQSITSNISIDCKRYLDRIIHINRAKKQVSVECGVVLATLNEALAQHGLMLGPTVATADRATIGGMLGNDSAGKGSNVYGKMSDCVVSLSTVLRGGVIWESKAINNDAMASIEQVHGIVGDVHTEVKRACEEAKPFLEKHWPNLPRFVSGYNLPMAWDGHTFDLNRILCGSEGTLGIITEATLQCVEIPKNQKLIVVGLKSFDGALRLGASIAHFKPSAVEVVDELVLESARKEAPDSIDKESNAVLFIECDDGKEILSAIKSSGEIVSAELLESADEIEKAWRFRNRSVGLLSSTGKDKRPIPFVEDCAVPPENLADFICEFQKLLDARNLRVGMFGHVDAGVIHVRPALDLSNQKDRLLIRTVTDEVALLVHAYGGVLWGEHGKGFRSEYGPQVFGDGLWKQICRVKAIFDPTNQFNPEKVAGPSKHHPLISIDSTTRGEINNKASQLPILSNSLRCDGNSQCKSVKINEMMCPTFRSTDDPTHSPRGRSELLRHWLLRIGGRDVSSKSSTLFRFFNRFTRDDFSHDVHNALHGCLGCSACVSDCPMEIDIPQMRSVFLSYYYDRYPRPLRDVVWSRMEGLLPFKSSAIGKVLAPSWLSRFFGIVDPPQFSKKLRIKTTNIDSIVAKQPDIIILQDSFTTFFRSEVVLSFLKIIESLGLSAAVLPLKSSGKALQVRGKRNAFRQIAQRNVQWLQQLQSTNIPIVGIEPATTLLWRNEYPQILKSEFAQTTVLLPQEWLIEQDLSSLRVSGSWRLFPHCVEHAVADESDEQWRVIFERVGANVEVMNTSCCGMGGLFGHEREHKQQSIDIWGQSWGRHHPTTGESLATGYSCHSQAKRTEKLTLRHPLEALAQLQ